MKRPITVVIATGITADGGRDVLARTCLLTGGYHVVTPSQRQPSRHLKLSRLETSWIDGLPYAGYRL
jgi:hypothetical protein